MAERVYPADSPPVSGQFSDNFSSGEFPRKPATFLRIRFTMFLRRKTHTASNTFLRKKSIQVAAGAASAPPSPRFSSSSSSPESPSRLSTLSSVPKLPNTPSKDSQSQASICCRRLRVHPNLMSPLCHVTVTEK